MLWSPFAEFVAWWLAFVLLAFAGFGPLRRDKGAAQAYLIAVVLHIAAAAIYVYIPDVLPSRADASAFHKYALLRQWSEGSDGWVIGSRLYEELLGYVYRLFGPSYFLGAVLSIYAFALSVIVLVRFMELLDIRQGKSLVILLFGALPTAVLYGSVPMREPYQVLFFMLACYYLLRFRLSSQPLHLIAGAFFALMMGILHKGLVVYAPFLVVVMLLVRVDHHPGSGRAPWLHVYLHRIVAAGLAIGFVVGISAAEDQLREISGAQLLLKATATDALVEHTSEARGEKALTDGRTAYGVALDTSTPVHLVYSSIMILTYYMFTPFPWQIGHPRDLYAFAESLLRMACLFAIFRMWRRGGPINPQIVVLLMVVYFSMAFLWSAGTFTWGTATRHHMIHQWIVLMLGVPALLEMRARSGRGAPLAAPADPPNGSEPGGTAPRWRRAGRRGGLAIPVPRRLGSQGLQPRGLRIGAVAPRSLAGGFGGLRRPARE